MRFERLGVTPVAVIEIDVEGASVTAREAGRTTTKQFASAAQAEAHVAARTTELRGQGYVPIKRLAAAPPEESVQRERRFTWIEDGKERTRVITQRDEVVRISEGAHVEPTIHRTFNIKAGSATFDKECVRAQKEVDAAAQRAQRAAEKAAVRKRKLDKQADRTNPALEAECLAAPDDPEVWRVYADWLLEEGSVLGEIAALALGGDYRAALHAAQDHFVELDTSSGARIWIELGHGFVRGVHVECNEPGGLAAVVRRVVASPACRFLDQLTLAGAGTDSAQWVDAVAAIAKSDRTIRSLTLAPADEDERYYIDYGTPDFGALTSLQRLVVAGGHLVLDSLPALRVYVRNTHQLARTELAALCERPRRALVELALRTGTAYTGCDLAAQDFDDLLRGTALPGLRHLGLLDSDLTSDLVPRLARSPLLPRLDSLDLSGGNLDAARPFGDHAAAFRHLAALDLSANRLDGFAIETIRGVLDNVITNQQFERYEELGE